MEAFIKRRPPPAGPLVLFTTAIALCVVLGLLVVVLVRLAPQWLTETEGLSPVQRDEARGRARTALFAILAGLIALAGAVYTGRTFALNRRGQITERFTRAIDQLGSDKIEIRLGGIYALERIAHESADEYGPILEVLTAYVRENSPWPTRETPTPTGAGPESPGSNAPDKDHAGPDSGDTPPSATVDIKAVLTVLARRALRHHKETGSGLELGRPNMRGVRAPGIDLRDAYVGDAQLQEANLVGAQLQGAILSGAQLQGASLDDAQLQGAYLDEAQLQRAYLHNAQLQEARLDQAHLEGANLGGARLQGARLPGAYLQHATFRGAQLQGAYLHRAQLQGANLEQAQLQKAFLGEAQLQGANLEQAQLQDAFLGHAQMQGADLGSAQIQGANLGSAQIQGANLTGASCDDATIWPDGFEWREAGAKLEPE